MTEPLDPATKYTGDDGVCKMAETYGLSQKNVRRLM